MNVGEYGCYEPAKEVSMRRISCICENPGRKLGPRYLEGSCTSKRFGEIIFFVDAALSASLLSAMFIPRRPPPLNLNAESLFPAEDCSLGVLPWYKFPEPVETENFASI
jgi:hypothetical protein